MFGDGLKATFVTVSADGKSTTVTYSAHFDGKDYPVTGDPSADTRSYKQINARTLALTNKKDGKVTLTGKITVSADGKTRTVSTSSTNASGKKISSTAVYNKQ